MKRLGIFAFYNSDGIVKPYVLFWLEQLKECTSDLIFVANGNLKKIYERSILEYASQIYIRDDVGMDIGAYKDVILNLFKSDLSVYDEVVFCNDSCWGPFTSLKKIFEEMERKNDIDLWGLCYTEYKYANHIPAMLMVFKKRIIKNELLQTYLRNEIDERTNDKWLLIASWEIGLFSFLVNEYNMKFAYYADIRNSNVYYDASVCIREFGLPVLKRRVVEEQFYNKKILLNILKYISRETAYDVDIIIKELKEDNNIVVTYNDLDFDGYRIERYVPTIYDDNCERDTIIKFIENRKFYIMGAGFTGVIAWWLYARNNPDFCGWIISDGQPMPKNDLFRDKVRYFSTIDLNDKYILVAMSKKNSDEVYRFLGDDKNVLYLNGHNN